MKPYNHQLDCLNNIDLCRKRGKDQAFIVLSPGLGKTAIAAFDAIRFIENIPNPRVLYLCHQNEILNQAKNTFQYISGECENTFGFLNGIDKDFDAKYLFASFQTMRESMNIFTPTQFDYIIVDEAHHTPADTYQPIVNYFKPKFKIGLTATPSRMDSRSVEKLFGGEPTFSLPLEDSLVLGLTSKIDYKLMTDEIVDLGQIESPIRIKLKDLNKKIFVPKRDEYIAKIIINKTQGVKDPRAIIFCSSIKHAEQFQPLIPNSVTIHSKINPKIQEERIKLFREGKINTILTIDKFNEGIDVPQLNIVIFLRTTSSNTIFDQQLGRGSRLFPGKDKLLVLDFVANCERISMIYDLFQKIQESKEKMKARFLTPREEDLIIDFGNFNFLEVSKDVVAMLKRIKTGYTKEILLDQLVKFASGLKSLPTRRLVDQQARMGLMADSTTFSKVFGSWTLAMKALGMGLNRQQELNKETLISQLKDLQNKLGRTPKHDDIKESSKKGCMASAATFRRVFGSCNYALIAAGIKISRKRQNSKEELIDQLKKLAEELGRTPRQIDINNASREKIASLSCFIKAFGSFDSAIETAGFKIEKNAVNLFNSKEELIDQLKKLSEELGRTPTSNDVTNASRKKIVSTSKLVYVFGSYAKAIEAAGLR